MNTHHMKVEVPTCFKPLLTWSLQQAGTSAPESARNAHCYLATTSSRRSKQMTLATAEVDYGYPMLQLQQPQANHQPPSLSRWAQHEKDTVKLESVPACGHSPPCHYVADASELRSAQQ